MKNTKLIGQEVEKTLDMLNQAESLPPDPYFYSRLKARITHKKQRYGILQKALNPVFFSLLVAINIGTAVWYFSGSTSGVNSQEQLTQILATDLQLENGQNVLLLFK